MDVAYIDFETYSESGYIQSLEGTWKSAGLGGKKGGISLVGAHAYAAHPSTEITRLSYLVPGFPLFGWNPGDPPPWPLLQWVANGGLVEAHNAEFEIAVWRHVAHEKLGWPMIPPSQFRCSAALCRKHGLPGHLADAAKVLGSTLKDKEGWNIMMRLCRPYTATKTRPEHRYTRARFPELWERQAAYCDQDVRAEKAISETLPPLSESDLAWWQSSLRMNLRGVAIDTALCHAGVKLAEDETQRGNEEIQRLTGGQVQSFTEVAKLQAFLGYLPDLQKETINQTLRKDGLAPDVRRLLELRRELSGGSVTKYQALLHYSTKGRARGLYIWHGTHPGRHTGTGPQPANFPRGESLQVHHCPCGQYFGASIASCPKCHGQEAVLEDWSPEAADVAIAELKSFDAQTLRSRWGALTPLLGSTLRGAFIAGPGKDLISTDYTAMQAVILAALAKEQWRLEVFARKGSIYLESAAKITGVPIAEYEQYKRDTGHHHPIRRLGKVAELASGFQGWINSWKVFGADKFLETDEDIKQNILKWRAASPSIVHMWYRFEDCAISAVLRPGESFEYNGITFFTREDTLIIRLLSGRELWYREPRLEPNERWVPERRKWPDYPGPRDRFALSYCGHNSDPTKGPLGYVRRNTWGGRLTENVVMATEVDIVTDRKHALESAGYLPVLETYDEITSEADEGHGSVEEYEAILEDMPSWCEGWPIFADGGWRGKRYRKA